MESLTPAAETVTYKIDDLFHKKLEAWTAHVAESKKFAAENASLLVDATTKNDEFKSYAETLTQVLRPYAFPKKYSRRFVDRGYGDLHSGYVSEFRAGFTETEIGAVDYWAAATVDPFFRSLCQQRAGLADKVRHAKPGSEGSFIRNFSEDGSERSWENNAVYRWDDTARGLLRRVTDLEGANYDGVSNADIGAIFRLNKKLKRRFNSLMRHRKTRDGIGRLTKYMADTYQGIRKDLDQSYDGFRKFYADDPAGNNGLLTDLHHLAYLKYLGIETVASREDRLPYAIEKAVEERTTSSGGLAPVFDTDDYKLMTKLDGMIFDDNHAEKAPAPLVPRRTSDDYDLYRMPPRAKISKPYAREFLAKAASMAHLG